MKSGIILLTYEYFLVFLIIKKINDIAEKENNPKKTVCTVKTANSNLYLFLRILQTWKKEMLRKKEEPSDKIN